MIGEAEIGGQSREGALAAGQALERGAGAQPHPVARERVTRGGAEDAAEVMGGDAEIGGQFGERAVRVGGQRLMRGVGEGSPFADGGGPAGGDTLGIRLLQRRRGEQDRAFAELVGGLAAAARGEQQAMLQIDRGRAGHGLRGKGGITAPERRERAGLERDGGAVVAVVVRVVVALLLAGIDAVGARRVEQVLDAVDGAQGSSRGARTRPRGAAPRRCARARADDGN
jgi:hypothetical protein